MGQRHQVMLVLPKKYYNENNPNNEDESIVAIHHQWLWGSRAVQLLSEFLDFVQKMNKGVTYPSVEWLPYHLSHYAYAQEILATSYSISKQNGYFHRTHGLNYVHPDTFDNNDGVTVIDLRQKIPKYCFFAIHDFEGKKSAKNFFPYSAKEYTSFYVESTEFNSVQILTSSELKGILNLAKKQDKKTKKEEERREKLKKIDFNTILKKGD